MSFINPYNFVRVPPVKRGLGAPAIHRFKGWSGSLGCKLHLLTPTLVVGAKDGSALSQAVDSKRRPIVPGTALRGMVRAIFEVLTASCDSNSSEDACSDPGNCCLACRIFGMVAGDDHRSGLVRFTDATGDIKMLEQVDLRLPREGPPKKEHRPFYFDQNGLPRGRKFYYHHEPPDDWEEPAGQSVLSWLRSECEMFFHVHFSGLNEAELETLVFALVLEENLGHKIGHGRPLGLGSCLISLTQQDTTLRADSENSAAPFTGFEYSDFALTDHIINGMIDSARKNVPACVYKPTIDDMRIMLRLNECHPRHYHMIPIRYPSDAWFWYERHSLTKTALPTVQEVDANTKVLDETPLGRTILLRKRMLPYRRQDSTAIKRDWVILRLPGLGNAVIHARDIEACWVGGRIYDLETFMESNVIFVEITGVDPLSVKVTGTKEAKGART